MRRLRRATPPSNKRPRQKRRKERAASAFIDDEAEHSDESEETEEDDEDSGGSFIDDGDESNVAVDLRARFAAEAQLDGAGVGEGGRGAGERAARRGVDRASLVVSLCLDDSEPDGR